MKTIISNIITALIAVFVGIFIGMNSVNSCNLPNEKILCVKKSDTVRIRLFI